MIPSDRPPIRTFKPRRRPLTAERAEQWERLGPRYLVDVGDDMVSPSPFGRDAPLVVDIGIGFGESAIEMAAADPGTDVIGCDVHTPGIAAALARIDELALSNLRLLHGDALELLGTMPDGRLDGLRIFFPDPWPKARHRHRRLTNHVDDLVRVLAPGGTIHVATDIEDYVAFTLRLFAEHPSLTGGVIDRPAWRPVTRYERKGERAGRRAVDLLHTVTR